MKGATKLLVSKTLERKSMDIFHVELESSRGNEKIFTGYAESEEAMLKEMADQYPRHQVKSIENSRTGETKTWV